MRFGRDLTPWLQGGLLGVQPLFFALQEVAVGIDFQIESSLDVHQFLVRSEVVSHLGLEVLDLVLESTDGVLEKIIKSRNILCATLIF